MLSAIKFGTAQFLTSNPPANTVCLALDFDDKKLYMVTSECKVLLSDLMTEHLLDENGKIKQEYLDNGSIVEVPTKTSQLVNDSGFITKDTHTLTYYLTKDATLAEINKNVAYLNTKIEQEVLNLQNQINGLSGSYVYIGKIDSTNPTQEELTQAAMQFKGAVNVGYVIVDGSQREWYYDGSVWNDFGTASSEIAWDAVQNKPNLVEYQAIGKKTESIVLKNDQNLLGTDTNGSMYNLAMVSQWNKADFGSASIPMNLNSVSGVVTINDNKVVATTDQIPVDYVVSSDLTDVVRYQNLDNDKKTESIVLKNDQAVFGTDLSGGLYNLAMVSRWNKADFGSSAIELNLNAKDGKVTINDDKVLATTDQIPTDYVKDEDISDVVRYQNLGEYKNQSILLSNDNAIFGTGTDGTQYNVAMISRWNKADFGSGSIELNLNAKDGKVTINDNKVVATLDDISAVATEAATEAATTAANAAVEKAVGTEDDLTKTFEAINALSLKIETI